MHCNESDLFSSCDKQNKTKSEEEKTNEQSHLASLLNCTSDNDKNERIQQKKKNKRKHSHTSKSVEKLSPSDFSTMQFSYRVSHEMQDASHIFRTVQPQLIQLPRTVLSCVRDAHCTLVACISSVRSCTVQVSCLLCNRVL